MVTNKLFKITFIVSLAVFSNASYAINIPSIPDLSQLIENLSNTIPNLMEFVTALAYVMGMFFVFKGVLALKQYGEQRTMMSSSHDLKGPLIYLFVGTALLYLPSMVHASLSTFWDNPNPYAYVNEGVKDPWQQLMEAIFMVVQLIGTIAFIRGLVILSHLGGQGQPGTFGRAMAHLVGGVLCINIYQFIETVKNTLALGQT